MVQTLACTESKSADSDAEQLWARQNPDGGWSQEPGMASDAYATGQSLVMLIQLSSRDRPIHRNVRYQRGIRFLLESQLPDGSWHVVTRAIPVQEYFDNGDPHGKDQFISLMATGWATAALGTYARPDSAARPLDFASY